MCSSPRVRSWSPSQPLGRLSSCCDLLQFLADEAAILAPAPPIAAYHHTIPRFHDSSPSTLASILDFSFLLPIVFVVRFVRRTLTLWPVLMICEHPHAFRSLLILNHVARRCFVLLNGPPVHEYFAIQCSHVVLQLILVAKYHSIVLHV